MKTLVTLLSVLISSLLVHAGGGCNNLFTRLSPDGQWMYFSSDRHGGGNYEIYRCRTNGWSDLERLTNSSVNNLYPSINPDGSKIVFQRGDYGSSSEVWIMNSDGTGQVQLTNNSGHDGSPAFSRDGQTIVFDGWDTDPYPEIFTMDLTGGNRTQLTNIAGADWQCAPIYSPSGAHIYFSKGYNADNHIVKMDLNGANWVDITGPNTFGIGEFNLEFSPDGSRIIFGTSEYTGYNNGSDLVIADTTGANWNVITSSAGGEWWYHAFWNPVNNQLYVSYNPSSSGQWQIYEMDTSGATFNQITDCSGLIIVEQSGISQLSVMPNPATDVVTVTGNGIAKLEFYDVTGRMVLTEDGTSANLSMLNNGFYTIVARNSSREIVGRSQVVKK